MNSDETGPGSEPGSRHLLDRRTALRGAAVVASLAWVAPGVQVVSMTTAHAASAPPPGVRPPLERPPVQRPERPPAEGPSTQTPPGRAPGETPPELGAVEERPPASRGGTARGPVPAEGRGVAAAPPQVALARTGTSPWGAVGVGTATVATGAAAIAAANRLKQRQDGTRGTASSAATGGDPSADSPLE